MLSTPQPFPLALPSNPSLIPTYLYHNYTCVAIHTITYTFIIIIIPINTYFRKKTHHDIHVLPCSPPLRSFYGGFQVCKYGLKLSSPDLDNVGNAVGAGVFSILPMLPSAYFRRHIPYAMVLIAIDVYNEVADSSKSS